MFTLVFWFGLTNPQLGTIQGYTSQQECTRAAGMIESARRLQLNQAYIPKHKTEFEFVCVPEGVVK